MIAVGLLSSLIEGMHLLNKQLLRNLLPTIVHPEQSSAAAGATLFFPFPLL